MTFKKYRLVSTHKDYSSDLVTPVAAYLRLRNTYAGTILLESSEYNTKQNSKSIIGVNPIYGLKENKGSLLISVHQKVVAEQAFKGKDIEGHCVNFFNSLELSSPQDGLVNGFLGYQNFDIFSMAEDIHISQPTSVDIPNIRYDIYEFVLVFDHYINTLTIIRNEIEGITSSESIDNIYKLILSQPIVEGNITYHEEELSDTTEADFIQMVEKGKYHCRRGDVFQIVLSRHFKRKYSGDEFMLYRKLRSVNPSPYLFYFDYIDYQLLGSSPEAQIIIQQGKAILNPIAGTFRRQGNADIDLLNTQKLLNDKKENAEHIMLVDLARNDLSKFCTQVEIASLKEIQMYSHVIHIVSKIVGKIKENIHPFSALLAVSPTGTLSGAPKHRAIELIGTYEKTNRSFYGGSVGIIDFSGGINQAIIIRSCLAKDSFIHYRAGAGIVDASVPETESQEVYNKISAIRKCFS